MELKDNSFYPITDVQKLVDWSSKKLQRYAKKRQLRKIDGRYLFTGINIKDIIRINDIQTTSSRQITINSDNLTSLEESLKAMTLKYEEAKTDVGKQVDLQVQSLKLEIKKLKKENKILKLELTNDIPHQEKLKKAIQLITLEAMEQGVTHKIFTEEEYTDILGTITEVDFQKEQVNYLRGRVEKQDGILEKLVQQVSERNFIEAKSKGYDKKG